MRAVAAKRISPQLHRRYTEAWQRLVVAVMTSSTERVQRMSPRTAYRFGATLGRFGWRVAGRARQQALSNLTLAYGDALTAGERAKLVRNVFKHFGRATVEFLRGPLWTREKLTHDISVDGYEHLAEAKKRGGIVLFTAHLGNWEILGRWLVEIAGIRLTVVAREPENPALGDYLRRTREGAGFAVLSKGESARDLLRILKRGETICLLPDQNSGDLFVPFFGVPAGTVAGPASLALHTGAPLLPIFCVRRDDGNFHIVCSPEIIPPAELTDKAARTEWMMREVNARIETTIRTYPDQWLWLHNRWKSAFEEKNRERAWGEEGTDRGGGVGVRIGFAEALERRG